MAFLQQLVVGAIILAAIAASEPNPSCVRTCGSLNIPYPFGTSEGCYLDPSFLITCNNSTPLLSPGNIIKVINISWDGELRVSNSIDRYCPGNSSSDMASEPTVLNFPVSHTKNKLTAVGCDTFGFINATEAQKKYSVGCLSLCDSIDSVVNGSCEGIGCCQTSIPKGMTSFAFTAGSLSNPSTVDNFNPCSFAFVVEEKAYNFSSLDLVNLQNRQTVPMVLDWAVGNETCRDAKKNSTTYACKAANSECYDSTNSPGYLCKCHSGYEGNPYLFDGCNGNDIYIPILFLPFFFPFGWAIYIYMTSWLFQILMSAKKIQTPAAMKENAPTLRGVSNVIVPRGSPKKTIAVVKSALLKKALLQWVSI
jgi:hypothetical protein